MNHENNILLVDDEPLVIQGLIRHLRKEPYRIWSATSAQEALQILANHKMDVLITDERMPGMTGSELVTHVRREYPHIICMMLSGETNFNAAIRAINEGEIYRYLRKPCDPLDVATSIRLALAQRNLVFQARRLLDEHQKSMTCLKQMEKKHPGLFDLEYDEEGRIVVESDVVETDSRQILSDIEDCLSAKDRSGHERKPR